MTEDIESDTSTLLLPDVASSLAHGLNQLHEGNFREGAASLNYVAFTLRRLDVEKTASFIDDLWSTE